MGQGDRTSAGVLSSNCVCFALSRTASAHTSVDAGVMLPRPTSVRCITLNQLWHAIQPVSKLLVPVGARLFVCCVYLFRHAKQGRQQCWWDAVWWWRWFRVSPIKTAAYLDISDVCVCAYVRCLCVFHCRRVNICPQALLTPLFTQSRARFTPLLLSLCLITVCVCVPVRRHVCT